MTRRAYCLLACVMLVSALAVLPARWVMAWIPDQALVLVTDAQGSLWAGQARLAVGIPAQRRSLPDPLRWRFGFSPGPQITLTHPWLQGPLVLFVGWQGLQVSAQSFRVPAVMLTTFHALFNTLNPGGEILLQWPDLQLGLRGPQALQAGMPVLQAQWLAASSELSRIRPLGNYAVSVTRAEVGSYTIQLSTNSGPLRLQGQGGLDAAGRFQFQGWAWADPALADDKQMALRGLLDALGPVNSPDGRRSMRMHS